MAKKRKNDLDDFDFDDDIFSDSGFGDDEESSKEPKSPIRVLTTSFAEGAAETLASPSKIKELTRHALPKSYSSAFDAADTIGDTGRRLYDTAAAELKPIMPSIRKAAGKLYEKSDGLAPAGLRSLLKEFSERSDSSYRTPTQDELDNTQMSEEIGKIFKETSEADAKRSAVDRAERYLRDRVQDKQSDRLALGINMLANKTERLVAYQDAVTYKYQQKTLENSFRQTFYLRDILTASKETRQILSEGLKAITYNTAIPDFQKKGVGDSLHENLRNRVIGGLQNQASKFTGDYFKKVTDGLHDRFKDTLGNIVGMVEQGQSASEVMADMEEAGIEGGKLGMAGRTVGGMVADWLAPKAMLPFQKLFEKRGRVNDGGEKSKFYLSQIPERIMKMKRDGVDDLGSPIGAVWQALLDLLPDFTSDRSIGGSAIMKAEQPVPWDNMSRRSIVEIIPGFLSRIHHELANIRSGMGFKLTTPRIVYNSDSNKFDTEKGASADVRKRLLDPGMMHNVQTSTNAVVNHSDDGSLTAAQRKLMADKLVEASQNLELMDEDLFSAKRMGKGIPEKDRKAIEKSYLATLKDASGEIDHAKLNARVELQKKVRDSMPDPSDVMKVYRDNGQIEQLRSLGLTRMDGFTEKLDADRFRRYVLEGKGIEKVKPKKEDDWFASKRREFQTKWENKSEDIADAIHGNAVYQSVTSSIGEGFDKVFAKVSAIFDRLSRSEEDDLLAELAGETEAAEPTTSAEGVGAKTTKSAPQSKSRGKKTKTGSKSKRSKRSTPLKADPADTVTGDVEDYETPTSKPRLKARRKRAGLRERIADGLRARAEAVQNAVNPHLDNAKAQGARYSNVFESHGLVGAAGLLSQDAGRLGQTVKAQYQQSSMAGMADKLSDIYAKGGTQALLDAAKLSAGHYKDQLTGDTIKRLEDISGPIVDEAGKLVVSAEQLAAGLYDSAGRELKSITARAKKRIQGLKAAAVHRLNQTQTTATPHLQQPTTLAGQVQQETDERSMNDEHLQKIAELSAGQLEILNAIYQTVAQVAANGLPQGESNVPTAPPGFLKRNFGRLGGVFGGIGRGAWGGAKLFGSYTKGVYKMLWGGTKLAGKGAFGAVGGVLKTGWGALSPAQRRARRQSDVYRKGDMSTPVLYKNLMVEGAYLDVTTNKVINTVDDIKGAVKNLKTGNIDLTQDDFDAGITDNVGRNLGTAMKKAIKAVGGAFMGYTGSVLALPFKLAQQAVKLVGKTAEMVNEGQDVYLKGRLDKPVMLNRDIKAGKYFDGATGNRIRSYRDVKGEVYYFDPVTKEKRVVITAEEARTLPLVNWRGKPIRTIGQWGIGALGSAARLGIDSAVGLAKGYAKVMGAALGVGRDVLIGTAKGIGRFFNPNGRFGRVEVTADERQIRILEDIFGLLMDRLPVPKKLRKGSWQEQFELRSAKEKEDEERKEERDGKGGLFGRLKNLFSKGKKGLLGMFGLGDDEEDEDDDDDGSLLDDAADTADILDATGDIRERRRRAKRRKAAKKRLKRMKRGRGKVGRLGRLFGRGGSAARGATAAGTAARGATAAGTAARGGAGLALGGGLAVGAAGLAAGAGGAYVGSSAGDWASNKLGLAEDSGLRTGLNVAGGIGGGVGGAALGAVATPYIVGAAGSALAGIGAVLSAPVVLGAAAVAGVGYLGYKGYKAIQNRRDEPFRKLRMAQYGIDVKDIDKLEKLQSLEDICTDFIAFGPEGAQMDQSKLDPDKIFSTFDVDDGGFLGFFKKDNSSKRESFLRWFNGRFKPVYLTWHTALRSASGGKVKSLAEAWDKLTAQEKKLVLPKTKVSDSVYQVGYTPFPSEEIQTGSGPVEAAYKEAEAAIEKAISGAQKKSKFAGVIGERAGKMADALDSNAKWLPLPLALIAKQGAKALRKVQGKMTNIEADAKPPEKGGFSAGQQLSAIQAIRFKAYGLKGMQTDRVNALAVLERNVMKDTVFNGGTQATFLKTSSETYAKYAQYFGLAVDDEDRRDTWIEWFEKRFLPAFLTFASTAKQYLNTPNITLEMVEKQLKPDQLIAVARATVAAQRKKMMLFKASIWSFTTSPWDGEDNLNDDINTTRANIESIDAKAKTSNLSEEEAKKQAPADAGKKAPAAPANQKKPDAPPKTPPSASKPDVQAPDVTNKGERDLAREADAAYWASKGVDASKIQMVNNRITNANIPLAKGASVAGLNTDALWQKVSPLIAAGESMGGNYDAQNGVPGNIMKGLSTMTIGAVYNLIRQIASSDGSGPKTGAAGKYQFIGPTLLEAVKRVGLKMTDLFSPENQEKLARGTFDHRIKQGIGGGVVGILDALAKEWASLPSPSKGGRSWYQGDSAGNRAHGGMERLQELIAAVTGSMHDTAGSSPSPSNAGKATAVAKSSPSPSNAGKATAVAKPDSSNEKGEPGFLERAGTAVRDAVTLPGRMALNAGRYALNKLDSVGGAIGSAAYDATEYVKNGYKAVSGAVGRAVSDAETFAKDAVSDVASRASSMMGSGPAVKAALVATSRAASRSLGKCAKFVADALVAAGYKFARQASAYMYASNGILKQLGFTQIPNNSQVKAGDVMVYERSAAHKHGHIQIFNGQQWVSDFKQRGISPYRDFLPSTLWRDTGSANSPDFSNVTGGVQSTEALTAPTPSPDISDTAGLQAVSAYRDQSEQSNADRDSQVQQLNRMDVYKQSVEQHRDRMAGDETARIMSQSLDVASKSLDTLVEISSKLDSLTNAVREIKMPEAQPTETMTADTPSADGKNKPATRRPAVFEQKPSKSPLNVTRGVLRRA